MWCSIRSRVIWVALRQDLAEDLAVRDTEPTVFAGRPPPPAVGQPLPVGPGGQAMFDRPVPERRFRQPRGPRRAPPGPVLRAGVAPRAGRRLDRLEPGLLGPGQHVPPRVRLAA